MPFYSNQVSIRRGSRIFSGGGGVPNLRPEISTSTKKKRQMVIYGEINKYFLCDCLFVPLYFFFFFNIVSEHRGSCRGGESGGSPQENLSKTGSFSRENKQFDT